MASNPLASPTVWGVKVTLMAQLAPGATEVPQSLLSAKSAGGGPPPMSGLREAPSTSPTVVMLIALMFRLVVPVFVRVTVRGLLAVRRGWSPKLKGRGKSFTTVPTPIKVTTCGLPVALSAMVMVPFLTPFAVGVKVTLMVQELPAATPQAQLFVWEKSLLAVMVVMVSVALPRLLSVTRCEALVVSSN
jgi:hypothetical protein